MWRKPEYPEETTDLRQVTDEMFIHGWVLLRNTLFCSIDNGAIILIGLFVGLSMRTVSQTYVYILGCPVPTLHRILTPDT